MIKQSFAIALLVGVSVSSGVRGGSAQGSGQAGGPHGGEPKIAGVWRGNSACQVAGSPCHDETNVYRFSPVAGKKAAFSVAASKVVDGKEIVMGTCEWHYDSAKHELQSAMPAATLRFVVDENKMDGTLTLLDGKVYRRIHLVKGK